MLFSSITFLYFFLPLTILLYYGAPDRAKNFVLFVLSVLFYAWGEPVYVLLMLAEIVAAYGLTIAMQRLGESLAGRACYALSVLLPFALLFYFKFSPFLPIGISFYTFQIVSYCIDVRRGHVALQKSLLKLATYVTLFPQLVAGPIVRYADVAAVIDGTGDSDGAVGKEGKGSQGFLKSDTCVSFERGAVRFLVGLGKKVLIANVLGEFVAEVSALPHTQRGILLSWGYAAAICLQLYFDFSGYSDMAIGLGRMLGFSFPENFNYPFIAKSVSEFWRRWHMTLGGWFRDYVYIPLGGNRCGKLRWILNVLVVWMFTGLWHGAEWNFVLWGLSFAVLLVAEKAVKGLVRQRNMLTDVLRHGYMILVILGTFVLFHNTQLSGAWQDLTGLWRVPAGAQVDVVLNGYLLKNRLGILIIGIIGATPLPKKLWCGFCDRVSQTGAGRLAAVWLECAFSVALLLLCTAYLIDGSFNPFLYFRF